MGRAAGKAHAPRRRRIGSYRPKLAVGKRHRQSQDRSFIGIGLQRLCTRDGRRLIDRVILEADILRGPALASSAFVWCSNREPEAISA